MEHAWPATFSPKVVQPFLRRFTVSLIALEAWRRGLQVTLLDGRPRQIRVEDSNGHSVRFINSRPEMSSIEGVRLANDKHRANAVLAKAGFPTPVAHLIKADGAKHGDVLRAASEIGYPIVLKPLSGSKGAGVFTGIKNASELLSYFDHLVKDLKASQVILESHEEGEMDLRVLVIGSDVVGIIHRVAANVTGDGESTVSELIDAKNEDRSRNPFLRGGLIKKDQEVRNYVHAAGHTLDSVPAEGEYLRLRGKSNGSAGGDTWEASHLVSEETAREMVSIVQAFPGLYAAGVDILYSPARGRKAEKYTLIEINATPQIALNMYPMYGTGKDSPKAWIDACFPDSKRSGIPGEETLTFTLTEPLAALRAGTASKITLQPIPPSRLPQRSIFVFDVTVELQELTRQRLLRHALTHRISGQLVATGGHLMMHVAADDENTMSRFVRRAATVLGKHPISTEPWDDVVRLGFRIQT